MSLSGNDDGNDSKDKLQIKKKKAFFIVNQHAGKGLIKNNLVGVIDVLTKADIEPTVYVTQAKGDALRIAALKAKDYDLMICSGGDGTLDEVVTGMVQAGVNIPVGYIPAGSTNDFANSLMLPGKMRAAAKIICQGREFPCDIGTFNHDVFVYIAAFGVFTEVSYSTPQEYKNVLGHAAYILEGVKQLSNIQSYNLRIKYDDIILEDEYIYGMITNSYSVGGFKNLTGKDVELNDGVFEVTLIKSPKNPFELNSIITSILLNETNSELIHCFKADSLSIESLDDKDVLWTLDGEFGGAIKKVEIENHKKLLRIMVDQSFGIE